MKTGKYIGGATTKPAGKMVEKGLYESGRKGFGGADGLGANAGPGATTEPVFETDRPLKRGAGDVPDGRRSGDRNGVLPYFDSDKSRRGNDKPISRGGSNAEKSPFSSAARNISDRED